MATTELGFRLFALNTRRQPLNDPLFRQALAHLLPKHAVVRNIFKGFAEPADSYISPAAAFWRHPSLPEYEFSVDRAREKLRNAGYAWDNQGRLLTPAGNPQGRVPAATLSHP